MYKLNLTLKKKWFDMILLGEKKEEYRKIKDYWARRFIVCDNEMGPQSWDEMLNDMNSPYKNHNNPTELIRFFGCKLKQFDTICFKNGYRKDVPAFDIEIKYFQIKTGIEEWGGEPDKYYFTFGLGGILDT